MSAPTPGLWFRIVGRQGNGEALSQEEQIVSGTAPDHVGVVLILHDGSQAGNANARLIAAAPDLLAACEEWSEADSAYVSLDEQRRRWSGIMERMRAAIAKARGGK